MKGERISDWPARLLACVEAARTQPFAWGEHDCALWSANVVLQITGFDFGARFRGRYRTGGGAQRMIMRNGGLAMIATRALGEPRPALQAARGDVVLACREEGPALGVAVDRRAAFVGHTGLQFLLLSECVNSWRV